MMSRSSFSFSSLILTFTLALSGCGSSSDSTPATSDTSTSVTISGAVKTPSGAIARFEGDRPFMLSALDFFISESMAAITGLTGVPDATVELIRIADDGTQVGAVITTELTNSSGEYTLELPDGVEPSGDLVVQIRGTTETLRAIVSSEAVDISPISEFILDSLIAKGLILSQLNVDDIQALVDEVEALDIDLQTATTLAEAETILASDTTLAATIDTTITTVIGPALLSGAWDTGNEDGRMLVFYPNGFYLVYSQDAQDCPAGGVEYGTFTYDGSTMSPTATDDQNGQCGLVGDNPLDDIYTITITEDGNQIALDASGDSGPVSFARVTDGNPDSIVGGWNVDNASETRPLAIVFYPNGNYSHWQDTSFDENCIPGGIEYGTYSFDGATLSGTTTVDENNDCGLGSGPGSSFTFPATVSNNQWTITDESESASFDRLETSSASSTSTSYDMTQYTASSTIIFSECPNDPLGWSYTFTSTEMTLTGSDGWQTPACTTSPQETVSVDMTSIASDFDIPFNCTAYPICTSSDFNQSFSGIDQDSRSFTSTYSFNESTNTLTYVKSVEGTTTTEIIVLVQK